MLENKPVNLVRLNRIWDGIKSGELKHEQGHYHCGTSHCVAGWEVVFLSEENSIPLKVTENGNTNSETLYKLIKILDLDIDLNYISDNYVAQISLGLNDNETAMLFTSGARLNVQNALVDYLNTGNRLTTNLDCYSIAPFEHTDPCSIYLRGNKSHWDGFTDFLIEKEIEYSFGPQEL